MRSPAQEPVRIPGPFLKWVGGKRQLLPELLKRVPTKINTYYEPFLGGGALFFALAAEGRFREAVLSDMNESLVITYIEIRDNVENVIDRLIRMEERHCKDYYYEVRNTIPQDNAYIAARFIYLNKTCFNGLYRVNKSGQFNVPMGRYKNPKIYDSEGLRVASQALTNVSVLLQDFSRSDRVYRNIEPRDFVYLDPPYVPVSKTSNFTAFAAAGFDWSDHQRLASHIGIFAEKHVPFLLSNADTASTRELYGKFKVDRIEARRNVNSKGDKRGVVGELLVQPW